MKNRALLLDIISTNRMNDAYALDWLNIYNFLQDINAVASCFTQLETDLQRYAAQLPDKSFLQLNDDGKYVFTDNSTNSHKVLSGYLYQWARENGFKHKAKIIQALSDKDFYKLLTSHTIFKDDADDIGSHHGAWTHALQWYCIFLRQKNTHFLSHSPLSIYEEFSRGINKANMNLWHLMLDKVGARDFSSPEFTLRFILEEHQRWPLLAECLRRRQHKLLYKFETTDAYITSLRKKHADELRDGVISTPFKSYKKC